MSILENCLAKCTGTVTLDIQINPRNGTLTSTSEVRYTNGSYECICEPEDANFDDQGNIQCDIDPKGIEVGYSGGFNMLVITPVTFYCTKGFCADGISSPPGFPPHECIGNGIIPDFTDSLDTQFELAHGMLEDYYPSGAPGGGPGEVYEKCLADTEGKFGGDAVASMLRCLQKQGGRNGEGMVKKVLQGLICAMFSGEYGSISEGLCPYTDCGEPELPDMGGEINI